MREVDLGVTGKILIGFVALAVAWIALQSGVLTAIVALGVSSPTIIGLLFLVVVAYWAVDEAEEGDDAGDVIDKTTDRIERWTAGFIDGTTALILGGLGIATVSGAEVLGLLNNLVDVGAMAPMAAAQIGTILAGLGLGMGALTTPAFAALAVGFLVIGLVAKRRASN
ncbi:MAG: hypothetical protein ABEJ47_01285 [Halorhabdus sp.]